MHSKTNRQNHDFQIAYFLAGSCHTPDAAYALLCDLRSDREDALKACDAVTWKTAAKKLRAERNLLSDDEAERLDGKAELSEIESLAATTKKNVEAARAELAYINKCIEEIQPQRKYAHLPDPEAFEACQRDEWKLEFIRRIENAYLTTGAVPTDQFEAMRLHPDFIQEILPAFRAVCLHPPGPVGATKYLTEKESQPKMQLRVVKEGANHES